jgi:hypothetical protein
VLFAVPLLVLLPSTAYRASFAPTVVLLRTEKFQVGAAPVLIISARARMNMFVFDATLSE